MAKEKVQKKARDKWREKVWFTIMAPDFLGGKEIAMSPAEDGEAMVSRKVEVPISDLTGNFKRANAKAIFQVTGCQGSKCSTQFIGHYLSDDYIRRMVRRRKERIDIIRDYTTSDGSVVTFKVVIVTDGKLTNTKRLQIRHTVDGMLESKIRGHGLPGHRALHNRRGHIQRHHREHQGHIPPHKEGGAQEDRGEGPVRATGTGRAAAGSGDRGPCR